MMDRVISATEFKAKCLALLDEIDTPGGTITITKRGRPVAKVARPSRKKRKTSENILAGQYDIPDEVLMADRSEWWGCLRGRGE
jgi:prevent-host-death family protein